jgi:hypothetical protein
MTSAGSGPTTEAGSLKSPATGSNCGITRFAFRRPRLVTVLAMVAQPRLHSFGEAGQAAAVPFLQGVTGECMPSAAALIGQHRDLMHQVRMLRPTRGNRVGDLPDVLGDQPRDNRVQPQPQLLPQLRGTAARRLPRSGQKPHMASLAVIAGCRPTVASQHLSKLRFAGLVEGRRDGRRVLYRLRGAHVRTLLAEALLHADHQVSGKPTHD